MAAKLTKRQHEAVGERRSADIRMISNQDNWPQWPVLPIKRYDADRRMECACVLATLPATMAVYVNMWNISEDAIKMAKKITYVSVEAMVDDGWTVD